MSDTIVLGLGNPLMGDDGAGLVALAELERTFDFPADVEPLDGGVLGLQLLGRVEGAHTLLVLDAVRSGHAPGTVSALGAEEIRQAWSDRLSMHQVGFSEVLATAALRGQRPPRLLVIGVEPESVQPGLGLSTAVAAAIEGVVELAAQTLADWGAPLQRRCLPPPAMSWESMLRA